MKMKDMGFNHPQVVDSGVETKTLIKKPEDVIGFLREFNFGDRDESATAAVERFIEYIETRDIIPERLLPGEPKFTDLIIEELKNAGFLTRKTTTKDILIKIVNSFISVLAKIGIQGRKIIYHEKWTPEARKALDAVLKDFESQDPEWKKRVSQKHEKWKV